MELNWCRHAVVGISLLTSTVIPTSGWAYNSSRWGGFAAQSAQVGGLFTGVAGSWIVPSVFYKTGYPNNPNTENVSIWVGIGGNPETDNTLIQVGITSTVSRTAGASYTPFYETLPGVAQLITTGCLHQGSTTPVECSVAAADRITVNFTCSVNGAQCPDPMTFYVTMLNETADWFWTMKIPYESSQGSAEWIVEAPQLNGTITPLAGYTVVYFTDAAAGIPGDEAVQGLSIAANGVYMNNPNGGKTVPCAIAADDGVYSFTIEDNPSCPIGPIPVALSHDLNSDRMSDILLMQTSQVAVAKKAPDQETQSQAVALWLMSGNQVLQPEGLASAPAGWSIVGQRDFNGDGYTDILWRDTSGDVGIWLMNGEQVPTATGLGNVPTNWSVYGTGDLNGDGVGDLLWRDSNTGTVAIWFMSGGQVSSTASLGVVPSNWSIVGDDAIGDIFWRDTSGDMAIWQVEGSQVIWSAGLGNVPVNWVIAAIGDFNGDGNTDILWRDSDSGTVAVWLLTGAATVQSTATLGAIPSTWTIAQTGDYNGDNMSDILWIDAAGDVAIWFMNGGQIASTAGLGNVGTTWTVQSANAE